MRMGCGKRSKEKRTSFLKKRSKKLLLLGSELPGRSEPSDKSFLVLFFKKEHSYLAGTGVPTALGQTTRNSPIIAGNSTVAPIMFIRNITVSNNPMSAWNANGENTQVTTPRDNARPVKITAVPVSRKVCKYACSMVMPASK